MRYLAIITTLICISSASANAKSADCSHMDDKAFSDMLIFVMTDKGFLRESHNAGVFEGCELKKKSAQAHENAHSLGKIRFSEIMDEYAHCPVEERLKTSASIQSLAIGYATGYSVATANFTKSLPNKENECADYIYQSEKE